MLMRIAAFSTARAIDMSHPAGRRFDLKLVPATDVLPRGVLTTSELQYPLRRGCGAEPSVGASHPSTAVASPI